MSLTIGSMFSGVCPQQGAAAIRQLIDQAANA